MKKIILKLLALIITITSALSCKKVTSIDTDAISSVNVVNAINGAGGVRLNFNREVIALNSFQIQAIYAGSGHIKAYDAVSGVVYYNQPQTTVNGGLYSLYLTGTASTPEGVWVKDSIKTYGTENTTTTVRVVNLSPNAGSVNVTLASAPGTNVFSNVAYKTITAFQDFPLPVTIPENTNVFQFRDSSGIIIANFTLPDGARNRSYTIVLKGMVGGSGTTMIDCIGQQHY